MRHHRSKALCASLILSAGLLLGLGARAWAEVSTADQQPLVPAARSREQVTEGSGKWVVVLKKLQWQPSETAVIICDMWDQHWCKGATARVAEMAPYVNKIVAAARRKGVLIIHSPSGTMDYYKDHPARKRAQETPKAASLPADIGNWCNWISQREEKVGYPIDHSDGGCDCQPKCKEYSAWKKQTDAIEIQDGDAVSDSGVEVWNLLEQRGIKNVILMGVHTNMCVLGRPFGLRNLARNGKNVGLMRDLTDTMYNSQASPHVNHFTGTDLVVEHIEKFVCPTVTSTAITGAPQFIFKDDKRPRVVFISAEHEYGAAETLPEFADELVRKHGLYCEIVQGSPLKDGPNLHWIAGMEALTRADLVVVFARRRAFPADQMKYLRDYLAAGKPLIGLRTASHAFDTRGNTPAGHSDWPRFDPEVLGGNYTGHYNSGPKTTVTPAPGSQGHPILTGVELPFVSNGSLYQAKPLAPTATLLLTGAIPDQEPEPIAWTNKYGGSRIFYTSLGHPDDFANPQFRRLLVNAVFWAMDKPVPK